MPSKYHLNLLGIFVFVVLFISAFVSNYSNMPVEQEVKNEVVKIDTESGEKEVEKPDSFMWSFAKKHPYISCVLVLVVGYFCFISLVYVFVIC